MGIRRASANVDGGCFKKDRHFEVYGLREVVHGYTGRPRSDRTTHTKASWTNEFPHTLYNILYNAHSGSPPRRPLARDIRTVTSGRLSILSQTSDGPDEICMSLRNICLNAWNWDRV